MTTASGSHRTAVVVMTCHNRREKTLACLRTLSRQDPTVALAIFLVDDASTDGTWESVAREFPEVTLIAGTGDLYWNGGMALAYDHSELVERDLTIWVNDDVELAPDAIQRLVSVIDQRREQGSELAMVGGAFQDPISRRTTYTGLRRKDRLRPLKFTPIEPGPHPLACDVLHGNLVVVPETVRALVGNFDTTFTHGMGDFDYCLRARAAGVEVWLAPGHVGTCPDNPGVESYGEQPSARDRLATMLSIKNLPAHEWRVFARRYGGPAWPLYWLSPYVRVVARALRDAARGRARKTPPIV